jgi:hypothetical protein
MSKHASVRHGSSERAGNCTCLLRGADAIAQFTAIAPPKFPGPYRIRARLCIFASTRLKWQRRVRIRHTQPARLCFCDSRLPISRPSLPAAPPLKMRGSRRAANVNEPKRGLRKSATYVLAARQFLRKAFKKGGTFLEKALQELKPEYCFSPLSHHIAAEEFEHGLFSSDCLVVGEDSSDDHIATVVEGKRQHRFRR